MANDHEEEHDDIEEEDEDEDGLDLEDILSLDSLSANDASTIARDLTVAWIQHNKYEDNLSEDEVSTFYKTMYQAARFPTLWDSEDEDEDNGAEGNGALTSDDDE